LNDSGLGQTINIQKYCSYQTSGCGRMVHTYSPRAVFEKNKGFNEKIHFGEDYDYVSRSSRGAFGFTEKTYYYMDLRRARAEGIKVCS
jgi:hypothetical protein